MSENPLAGDLDHVLEHTHDISQGRLRCPFVVTADGMLCRSSLSAAGMPIWMWTTLLRARASRPNNIGSEHIIPLGKMVRDPVHPPTHHSASRGMLNGKAVP
jgi:hypothetical protein